MALTEEQIRALGLDQLSPLVVAVSGGRDYRDGGCLNRTLDLLERVYGIRLLIHGGASGADSLAGQWAYSREINCLRLPAKWKTHGRVAGYLRNSEIGTWTPHLWIFFPGGRGTQNAREVAKARHITALDIAA